MAILLAESGSTKTDWCLIHDSGRTTKYKTSGINPYIQTKEDIFKVLDEELKWPNKKTSINAVVFYGAGAGNPLKQKELKGFLKEYFKVRKVEVDGDMMAAAKGICGDEKGVVCILGTGSNSCYYNGSKIKKQHASLGYIAGDEGSGNHMGKRILRYYAYNTLDTELKAQFEYMFGDNVPVILDKLYKELFPNRYLASFVPFLSQNRGHYMVENIIEDSLNEFFTQHVLKYRESWNMPISFTGSVAYEFRDLIKKICDQSGLTLGKIEKSPMASLIKYHKNKMLTEKK